MVFDNMLGPLRWPPGSKRQANPAPQPFERPWIPGIARRVATLPLRERLAFTAAACERARPAYAITWQRTPTSVFDDRLEELWSLVERPDAMALRDLWSKVQAIPEWVAQEDLEGPPWIAKVALGTFDFPARLVDADDVEGRLSKCSDNSASLMSEFDYWLGDGSTVGGGPLELLDTEAQEAWVQVLLSSRREIALPREQLAEINESLLAGLEDLLPKIVAASGWPLRDPGTGARIGPPGAPQ
jgi:hypothetical protein